MKTVVSSAALLVLLWGGYGQALAGPVLEVTPKAFEFGRKAERDLAYPFEFVLKNTGDTVLKIEKLRPGCGCTKVELPSKELALGADVKLTGELNTRGFEGPTQKTIYLTTNEDGKAANHHLALKIVLPYSQTGLRISPRNSKTVLARPAKDRIQANIVLENCNREGVLHATEIVLPDGWTCETPLPVAVNAESRAVLRVTRALGDGEPFPDAPFMLKTDCADAPELKASFKYHDIKKVAAAQTEALKKTATVRKATTPVPAPDGTATPVLQGPEPPPADQTGDDVNAEKNDDEE